jgi:hypothetical protein
VAAASLVVSRIAVITVRKGAAARNAPVLAAVVISVVAVLCGCGQQRTQSGAARAHATTRSSATAGSRATASSRVTAGSGAGAAVGCRGASPAQSVVFLGNRDNHRSLCVRRSTAVLVDLRGSVTSRWAAIHASSAVLRRIPRAIRNQTGGWTRAAFLAVRPGVATLTSIRHVCGPSVTTGNGASEPRARQCGALLVFRVTVTVT